MVDAVSGTGTDTSAIGRTRLAESFDTFLSLLTAQLKNQDPLSPLDSNQFTQQIVQMTGVEQQLLTNDLLKSLVSNTTNGVSTAVSLIGKEVRAATTDAKLQNGKAEWVYTLPRDANDVKIEVLDSRGKVVKVLPPVDKGTKAGDHKVSWDGKDANGTKMPDGIYSLRVSAKDSDFATVPAMVSIEGIVTGVEQSNGETLITVNGAPVLVEPHHHYQTGPDHAAALGHGQWNEHRCGHGGRYLHAAAGGRLGLQQQPGRQNVVSTGGSQSRPSAGSGSNGEERN